MALPNDSTIPSDQQLSLVLVSRLARAPHRSPYAGAAVHSKAIGVIGLDLAPYQTPIVYLVMRPDCDNERALSVRP